MCASSAPVFPLAEILVSFSYDAGGGDDYDGGFFFFGLDGGLNHVSAGASSGRLQSTGISASLRKYLEDLVTKTTRK